MANEIQQSTQPTQITPANKQLSGLRFLLDKTKDQIAVALPRHLSAERMIRVVMTAVQKTPKLLECDQLSIVGAVVQASQLGLEPDGVLGQAYLVPFFNGKTKRLEAQLQIGYRGFISLARRSGDIQSLSAHVVYEADEFAYSFGLRERLDHVPAEDEDRGKPTHAWALVRFKDSGYQFDVMTVSEIQRVRQTSKAKDDGPWVSHWAEMAKKTVIRRLAKLLPMSVEDSAIVKAAVLDEYADSGIAQGLAGEIDSASEAARIATQTKTDAIVGKYRPEDESQATGHRPEDESQETVVSSAGVMSDLEGLKTNAQVEANETGKPVSFKFLGMTITMDPEISGDPLSVPAEEGQPLAPPAESSPASSRPTEQASATSHGLPLNFGAKDKRK